MMVNSLIQKKHWMVHLVQLDGIQDFVWMERVNLLIVLANLANLTGIGSFEFQIFGYFDGVGNNQKKDTIIVGFVHLKI